MTLVEIFIERAAKDANIMGESLREYCFKEHYGCYSCFELIDSFEEVKPDHDYWQDLAFKSHYSNPEDEFYNDCSFYCYHSQKLNITVGWYWDSDGTLIFKHKDKYILNTDCKKSNHWEFV